MLKFKKLRHQDIKAITNTHSLWNLFKIDSMAVNKNQIAQ